MTNGTNLQGHAYLRLNQIVPGLLPVSRATWWRWVAQGQAPKPVKLSPGCTAWKAADVLEFLKSKDAAQAGAQGGAE